MPATFHFIDYEERKILPDADAGLTVTYRQRDRKLGGYVFADFFACDIETATPEELEENYLGPSGGVGVLWVWEEYA